MELMVETLGILGIFLAGCLLGGLATLDIKEYLDKRDEEES